MTTVAMYDAVNGIEVALGISTREYALVSPTGAPAIASRRAAAAAAAHAVLVALAPGRAAALDAALDAELTALGGASHPWVAAGRAWGESVGEDVVLLRQSDGSAGTENIPAGSAPGEYRATFNAQFRHMLPFGIVAKEPYLSAGPPALTSPEYATAFNEVKVFGKQDGDPERNAISNFWLAESGTVRETGTWFQAAVAIVEQQGTLELLSPTARLFALIGMAVADAVVVSTESKAEYFSWRPTSAIREADTDGNLATAADPTWVSRIGSPGASPEHTSGTSTFAGAASTVLARFYCNDHIPFSFETDGASQGPRTYPRFSAGAAEAGQSRIYQGIHFQFSNQAGLQGGRGIGEEVVTTRLRRIGAQPWWTALCPQW